MKKTKLSKGQTLVLLLLDLQRGKQIRSEIMKKYDLSERTLRRYMAELRELGLYIKRQGFGNPVERGDQTIEFTDSYYILEEE